MGLLGHDFHALFAITGGRDLLEAELLQRVTEQQATGDLIVDDQNFDFSARDMLFASFSSGGGAFQYFFPD